MSSVERGKVVVSIVLATRVAEALGVTLSVLGRDAEELQEKSAS